VGKQGLGDSLVIPDLKHNKAILPLPIKKGGVNSQSQVTPAKAARLVRDPVQRASKERVADFLNMVSQTSNSDNFRNNQPMGGR